MALDKGLVQNINLKANGDQLLGPLRAFGREINKNIADLNRLMNGFSTGAHKQDNQLRAQIQTIQRMIGEASTLQNILTGAGGRKRSTLLAGLDEQSMGKKAVSASKLKRELEGTKSAADALEIRLAQLYKRFNALADAGRRVGNRDIAKAMNTEEAIRQVRRLEQALAQLDARQRTTGSPLTGDAAKLRAQLASAQSSLLTRIQNPSRSGWSTEIAQVQILTDRLRVLTRAQQEQAIAADRAAQTRRRDMMGQANLSEAQLRSQVGRGASQFRYTPDQARGFDIRAVTGQVDAGIAGLQRYQAAMARAVAGNATNASLGRLSQGFENLKKRIAEAEAQKRSFDALPENRMRAFNEMLLGGGGVQLLARSAAIGVGLSAAFAVLGAITAGARNVVQLEDALAQLQAIAGATDIEMRKMAQSILEVGQNSKFSVLEITQAATAIAQAGFSAQETSSVLKDALTLATASGSSPAESVETLTSALGAFQLQASESTRVVDTLVQGLNKSKLTIGQVQAAIQYVGATAKENNVRFEELIVLTSSLANAGIRSGSTQGTGLRQFLVDLQKPTEDLKNELSAVGLTLADVDVSALGATEVIRRLSDAGFGAAAAYNALEVRAASSYLALAGQKDGFDELALSVAQSGAAAEAEERAMGSLSASFTTLTNSLLKLIAGLAGPLMAALKTVVDGVTVIIQVMAAANEATGGFAGAILVLAGAFAINPIVGVVTGLTMVIGLFREASDQTEELAAQTAEATSKFESQKETLASVDQAVSDLIDREITLKGNKVALQAETVTLTTRFSDLANELVGTAGNYDNLVSAMFRYRGEVARQAALGAEGAKIAAVDQKEGLRDQLTSNIKGFGIQRLTGPIEQITPSFRNGIYAEALALGESNNGVGLDAQNNVQAMLNRLRKTGNPSAQALITKLQERLDLMRQIASLNTKIDTYDRQIGVYQVQASKSGQVWDRAVAETQSGVNKGLNANKDTPGSGDAALQSVMAMAQRRIKVLTDSLQGLDTRSPKAMAINDTLVKLEAQVARVTREKAAADRDASKSMVKDEPGKRITADQAAAEIKRRVSGAHITDTTRSTFQQGVFDRRAGIKRDASKAPHVTDRALDMAPIPGMDPMEIVAILEDMGLEVTGGPVRRAGTRFIPVNHGTGAHWHFDWASKKTNFEKAGQAAANKEAEELKRLLESEADAGVGEQTARISRITNDAKAGSRPVGEMSLEMNDALGDYRAAKLNAFDVSNPPEGLSDALLKQRALARAAIEAQITEQVGNFHSQFYRQIADSAANMLDVGLAAADRAFENTKYVAEGGVRQGDSDTARLGNNINKGRFGAGTQYRQQRSNFNARLIADKGIVTGLEVKDTAYRAQKTGYEGQISSLTEGSEEQIAAKEKLFTVEEKLLEIQRQRNELQLSINDRTQAYANIPLADRLRESVAAWADNSGAMDTWGTTLENNVGPALDMFANQLATMFENIVSGTATVKQALTGFIKAFAQFVLQIIAKALALMAVKAILSAFGLELTSTPGGTAIGKKSFNGGSVGRGKGLYTGGPVTGLIGGGSIERGVKNRDSALYNLARGEHVIRSKSVDEIGVNNMEMINREGAKGLAKVAGAGANVMNFQRPKQETNVYVVQEKQAPPMGPNDVLVTIHNDIAQNGPTKRLIKQIAQGG